MIRQVAVLGCGPAGLLAAHAAHESGAKVVVFSVKQMSPIGGAQFLHRSIPGLTEERPDGLVEILHVGSDRVYAEKVYGNPGAPTSWKEYPDGHTEIWNMHAVYHKLWQRYAHWIVDQPITSDDLPLLLEKYDMVLSAIPAKALCDSGHEFVSQPVWITNKASFEGSVQNIIIYQGEEHVPWYRSSRIFGYGGTEYPHQVDGATRIRKPLSTDCDCWPEVVRLGRYGSWKKGLLIHHAYEETIKAMEGQRALF
jgi:hypothetical protein